MDHRFTFAQLPTYPFQRLYNYPSYIATRHSLLGVGHHQIESAAPRKLPEFVVDQPLCDFLDLHRIEGRRVLPGAAMVDFFARSSSSKTVKTIRFHVPLVLETPETQVHAGIDSEGSYSLIQNDSAGTKICSGAITQTIVVRTPKKLEKEPEVVPSQMMSKADVYECFKNVKFGEPFRTVQQIRIWTDHADADIKVSVTENPAHDRIRKLDACLHMFGAIASRVAPEVDDSEGAFLPTSLDDFTLHSDDIPADFMCRYYLPLEVERNGRLLSVSFEVLSHSGELLLSCRKYSVAWVPRGVVIQEKKAVEDPNSWLRNGWTKQNLPAQEDAIPHHKFDELLYIGTGSASRVLRALSNSAKDIVSINLVQDNTADTNSKVKTVPMDQLSTLPQVLRGRDLLIILDLTASNNVPGSNDFSSFYLQILSFMKFVMTSKLHITGLVALTSWSAPVDLYYEGLDLFSNNQVTSMALVGAVVQGMLRVFRRETGLDAVAWALDLPNIDTLSDNKLPFILNSEIQARHRAAFADTFVSYRRDSFDQTLSRLVPSLEPISEISTSRSVSGTTVIVGMGSIGSALAIALVAAGCNKVVFFGRRPESNPEVS
jgi:Polyketide synthase dehydratase